MYNTRSGALGPRPTGGTSVGLPRSVRSNRVHCPAVTIRFPLPLLALGLLLAAASASAAPPPMESASRQQAAHFYDLGLAHLQAGELQSARRAFERAQTLAPHSAVLMNLALVSYQLGDLTAALDYLDRLLRLRDPAADTHRPRAMALRQRWAGERPTAAEPAARPPFAGSPAAPAPSPRASKAPLAPAVTSSPQRSTASQTPLPQPPERGSLPASFPELPHAVEAATGGPRGPGPSAAPERRNRWSAFVAAGGGAALLATVAGVWLRNGPRYDRWRRESDALASLPPEQRDSPDAQRRRRHNDDLRRSIRGSDALALGGGLAGLCFLGVGVWWLWQDGASPQSASGALQLGPAGASYRLRF